VVELRAAKIFMGDTVAGDRGSAGAIAMVRTSVCW
jgi:hypothetical protein